MRFVVTGTNRGIGLELVRQLVARGDTVEAGVRSPHEANDLQAIAAREPARVRIHTCDITSDSGARGFASSLGEVPVDVLINNAGVFGKMQSLEDLDLDDVARTFDVNAVGAIRVTRAVLPLLRRGAARKIIHISSEMGSISENTNGGAYGYRMSKAALNMASRSMSVDLKKEGILSVVMNPGWVPTDMGGKNAPTPVTESISGMLAVIDGLTIEQTGMFFDYRSHPLSY